MLKVDLHLVSWNRPKMTELVIRTIHKNTKRNNFNLIVWDNASDESVQQMLGHFHDNGLIDRLIVAEQNYGLEFARQKMFLETVEGELFICVDNDCLPPPIDDDGRDWIERLVDLMQKYEDFGAISCRTQVMIGTGNIFEEADEAGDEIVPFPHPGGSLRIMRTSAVEQVGGWDLERPGRGAEERYICGKLNEAGYHTAFAAQIQCLHLFGTRGDGGTDRWGYNKNMKPEDTGHSDISHPVLEQGDSKEEVLKYASEQDTERYFND